MNELTSTSNISIPFLNSFLRQNTNEWRKSIPTPLNDNIVKINADYLKDHPELMENFKEISKELVKMGYKPKIINNLFLVTHFDSLLTAIDLLSKTENKWNHSFIEGDFSICFICEEGESDHRNLKQILEQRKNNELNISKFIKQQTKDNVSLFIAPQITNKDEEFSIKINLNTCQICFLEISDDNKFSLKCKHQFCIECIVYYLEEGIRNGKVSNILCPSKDCTENFLEEKIKSLISEESFKKYKKFLFREEIKMDSNNILCPIVDCEGYVKLSDSQKEKLTTNSEDNNKIIKKNTKYICSNRHNFCSNCRKIWHDDTSCEDDKEILEFSTNSGKIVKRCPKCKVWTEKDEGCNHMHCKLCLYDWCWICENHCPQEHFTNRSSPCFGKQFNEAGDPDIEYYLILQNQDSLFSSIFFFFTFSFLLINNCIRTVLNRNNPVNNNQNLNANTPSKFCLFLILNCFFGFIAVILALCNGIILLYIIVNISKMNTIENPFSKLIGLAMFFVIYLTFFTFGIVLSFTWLLICLIYTVIRLVRN